MVFLHEEGIDRNESEQSNKSYLFIYVCICIYTYSDRQGRRSRRSKSSSTGYGGSIHDVCVLINEIDDECIHIYDELYFRESSSVTSPAEYKYIEQEEHEIRSMTSQVLFFLFCWYMYIDI
jgi:hypothetical protein